MYIRRDVNSDGQSLVRSDDANSEDNKAGDGQAKRKQTSPAQITAAQCMHTVSGAWTALIELPKRTFSSALRKRRMINIIVSFTDLARSLPPISVYASKDQKDRRGLSVLAISVRSIL